MMFDLIRTTKRKIWDTFKHLHALGLHLFCCGSALLIMGADSRFVTSINQHNCILHCIWNQRQSCWWRHLLVLFVLRSICLIHSYPIKKRKKKKAPSSFVSTHIRDPPMCTLDTHRETGLLLNALCALHTPTIKCICLSSVCNFWWCSHTAGSPNPSPREKH